MCGVGCTDGLVVGVDVGEAHLREAAAAVQLVVPRVRLLAHVLHVGADQHLAQLHEVAVGLVLHYTYRYSFLNKEFRIPNRNFQILSIHNYSKNHYLILIIQLSLLRIFFKYKKKVYARDSLQVIILIGPNPEITLQFFLIGNYSTKHFFLLTCLSQLNTNNAGVLLVRFM